MLTWLEDFVSEFRNDIRDKVRVCVREERHRCNQRSAVVIDDILAEEEKKHLVQRIFFCIKINKIIPLAIFPKVRRE